MKPAQKTSRSSSTRRSSRLKPRASITKERPQRSNEKRFSVENDGYNVSTYSSLAVPRNQLPQGDSLKHSPRCLPLLTPPPFNLSLGSDLSNEVLLYMEQFDNSTIATSSTPLGSTRATFSHSKCVPMTATKEQRLALGSFSRGPLFNVSNCSEFDIKSTPANPSKPQGQSFLTTPTKAQTDNLHLSLWGIPEHVLDQYSCRGIKSMFPWQAECLTLPGVLEGGNLVYSAPTSAGKTLVAELLALKCALELKKKVMFVLPFVSIAHEKSNYLQQVLEPSGVKVGGFMGNQAPSGGFASIDIAICTIEKANSLVNRLLEENTAHLLGLVVVDELHMIGDSYRGYLLELLLTKLMYVCQKTTTSHNQLGTEPGHEQSKPHSSVQLVGMSATLPNLNALASWLGAQLYHTDFRPVPLQEMVKVGPNLYDTDFKSLREYNRAESLQGDEDDVLLICRETVSNGHSVLIFCPTKAWCENLAVTLGEANIVPNPDNQVLSTGKSGLVGVCEQLRRTQVGLDPSLERSIPHGVAFHHAGLTMEEREIVEGAFRQTQIKVLVATSTLSSGVNLPARLVIIRTPFFQRSLLDVLVYKQMVGRAGRKGIDQSGESILICKPNERSKIVKLLKSKPKAVTSCLGSSPLSSGKSNSATSSLPAMKRALLEVISSSTATTQRDIEAYVSCTLLYTEMKMKDKETSSTNTITSGLQSVVDPTVEFLLKNEFIATRSTQTHKQPALEAQEDELNNEGSSGELTYYATQLGMATVSSSLSPDEALIVFSDLKKARRNFVLENELHIIYLVTPVYVQNQWPTIDWYKYLCLWERLPPDMKHVAETLGVRESFLAQAVQGRIPERTAMQKESLRVHRRFYTALALHDLVHEVPIVYVTKRYGASKGLLQTLQSAAGTFAGMVTVFCNRLGWKNLELLLSQFQTRLSFGVERELCELVKISLLNGFRARVLFNAGFHTLPAIATANPVLIETCLRTAVPFKSYKKAFGEDALEKKEEPCTTWCAKLRRGLSESQAVREIVLEAQRILSDELKVPLSTWSNPHADHSKEMLKQTVKLSCVNSNVVKEPKIGCTRKCSESSNICNTAQEGHTKKPRLDLAQEVVPATNTETLPHDLPSKETGRTSGYSVTDSDRYVSSRVDCKPKDSEVTKDVTPHTGPSPHSVNMEIDLEACTKMPQINSSLQPGSKSKVKQYEHVEFIEDSFISFSPILSQDVCTTNAPCRNALNPVQEQTSSSQKEVYNREDLMQTESPEVMLTIPDSLTCSVDMSLSFSFNTYEMIDAACRAEGSSTSLLQSHESRNESSTSRKQLCGVEVIAESTIEEAVELLKIPQDPNLPSTLHMDRIPSHGRLVSNQTKSASKVFKTPSRVNKSKTILVTPSSSFVASPLCLRELSSLCSSQLSQSGVTIIDVTSNETLFDTFVSECLEQASLSFSVAASLVDQSNGIGSSVLQTRAAKGIPLPDGHEQVVGIALCWGELDVYYLSLCQSIEHISLDTRIKAVREIFTKSISSQRMMSYDLKKNVRRLALSCGVLPQRKTLDPTVGDWMLNPDLKEKTIHRMVLQYLPDQPALAEEDCDEIPLSNLATHATDPMVQASAESILAFLLTSKLEPLLESEGLYNPFIDIEMPSLLVLAKLELNGIGFSPEECTNLKDILQARISELERDAYSLANHTFSLTSPEDVAQVLFIELNLPSGSEPGLTGAKVQKTLGANTRRSRKKITHLSTAKNVLEKITSLHPLPGIILEWRRISSTLSKMVFPLFKEAVSHEDIDCVRIHPTAQIHTATGRVTLSDPSLQMVPKEFDIGTNLASSSVCAPILMSDSQYLEGCLTDDKTVDKTHSIPSSVCMRNVFVPFKGGVFLAADYSQLELRILAHMSSDVKLTRFLNQDGDVFKMIAGEWLGLLPEEVRDKQRQETKQICYGMLYGIGAKALGEQLGISDDDASQFMESFKRKYPAMKKFLSKTVQDCRDNGHICTLLGRKRFLPGIHSANVHARSQADRQAVNSTIQGSAADLVKTAMVKIDQKLQDLFERSVLTCPTDGTETSKVRPFKGACLVLQLHDELLYEVSERDLPQVAMVVKEGMENAMKMSVKFPVKIKVGCSWGKLEPYNIDLQ